MRLPSTELLMGVFGLAGAVLCTGCIVYRRGWRALEGELVTILAALACGAGICSAIHLIACAFAPSLLINLVDQSHVHRTAEELKLEIEFASGHFLEVLAGGVAALGVSVVGLAAACLKPEPRTASSGVGGKPPAATPRTP